MLSRLTERDYVGAVRSKDARAYFELGPLSVVRAPSCAPEGAVHGQAKGNAEPTAPAFRYVGPLCENEKIRPETLR